MHFFKALPLLVFLPVVLLASPSADTLLAVGPRAGHEELRVKGELILNLVFAKLGKAVKVQGCVPKKCGDYVTLGKADLEIARVKEYGELYPELIQGTTVLFELILSGFYIKPDIQFKSWKDLSKQNLKVAYNDGFIFHKIAVETHVADSLRVPITHLAEGVEAVKSGKADVYIEVNVTVRNEIKEDAFNRFKEVVLDTVFTYPYFNQKHKKLIPEFDKALKEVLDSLELNSKGKL